MSPPNGNKVLVHGYPEFALFPSERDFRPGWRGVIATCPYCGIQWGRMDFPAEPAHRRIFLATIPCGEHSTPNSPGATFRPILALLNLPLEALSRKLLEYETLIKAYRILNPPAKETHP